VQSITDFISSSFPFSVERSVETDDIHDFDCPITKIPESPALRRILQPRLDQLLASREPPKTIFPSEVARALNRQELDEAGLPSWRDGMIKIRATVAEMREVGEVEVL
jgi:hypothetical protein